jgi:hypothetical protein
VRGPPANGDPLAFLLAAEVETPAAGLAFVPALRELVGEAAADQLRVALLAQHVADLGTDLAPVRRPLGRLLYAPPALEGRALAQAWEQAFNRQLTWRLVAVRKPPSPYDTEPDAWQPGRPGTWSRSGPAGCASWRCWN